MEVPQPFNFTRLGRQLIAGLWFALAVQLKIPTVVLERSIGLRESGTAISLWPNAFRALQALDSAHVLDAYDSIPRFAPVQLRL